MDIRLLSADDIPQAKALWKEAFSDTDSFIDWYFDNKVLPGNSIGIFDDSLVSVVHMIQFTLSIQNKPLKTAFIAGAATSGKRRNEGLMRILLKESLSLMKSRGILMTHLYPFKHSFYERFGWATYSFVNNKTADIAKKGGMVEVKETYDINILSELYNGMMKNYDGYVIRDRREWEWRVSELKSDGGKIAVAYEGGRPQAYMMFFCEDDKISVIETVYSNDKYIDAITGYMLKKWNMKVEYFVPAFNSTDSDPFGMARVVDASGLLKEFGLERILEKMSIKDDFAEWNNIGQGQELGIGDLAVIVHGGKRKFRGESYYMPEYGFMNQNTCIFEEY